MKAISTAPLLCLSYLVALPSFSYAQEIDQLQAPRSQRTISDKELDAIAELHTAVESGDFKAIQKCLDAGAASTKVSNPACTRAEWGILKGA